MGNCGNCQDRATSRAIGANMSAAEKKESKTVKLLLLGPGASGKSTLFKQIQKIGQENYAFTDMDRLEGRKSIRMNVTQAMVHLAYQSQKLSQNEQYSHCKVDVDNPLNIQLPNEFAHLYSQSNNNNENNSNSNNISNNSFIANIHNMEFKGNEEYFESLHLAASVADNGPGIDRNKIEISDLNQFSFLIKKAVNLFVDSTDKLTAYGEFEWDDVYQVPETIDMGNAISLFWKLPAIHNTFNCRHGNFSFPDNLDYFFNKAQVIFDENYYPDDEDLLRMRVRTTGIISHHYQVTDLNNNLIGSSSSTQYTLELIDVGGQRSERKKWIKCFEGVRALIFVAALNHYASLLFESASVNAMHEALNLYQQTLKGKWFKKKPIIIFLNKEDLFEITLWHGHPLSMCFNGATEQWTGSNTKDSTWQGPDFDVNYDYTNDPQNIRGILQEMNIASPNNGDGLRLQWFQHCKNVAIDFIANEFIKLSMLDGRIADKDFYIHITCATLQNQVETVFTSCVHHVIMENLVYAGLLSPENPKQDGTIGTVDQPPAAMGNLGVHKYDQSDHLIKDLNPV